MRWVVVTALGVLLAGCAAPADQVSPMPVENSAPSPPATTEEAPVFRFQLLSATIEPCYPAELGNHAFKWYSNCRLLRFKAINPAEGSIEYPESDWSWLRADGAVFSSWAIRDAKVENLAPGFSTDLLLGILPSELDKGEILKITHSRGSGKPPQDFAPSFGPRKASPVAFASKLVPSNTGVFSEAKADLLLTVTSSDNSTLWNEIELGVGDFEFSRRNFTDTHVKLRIGEFCRGEESKSLGGIEYVGCQFPPVQPVRVGDQIAINSTSFPAGSKLTIRNCAAGQEIGAVILPERPFERSSERPSESPGTPGCPRLSS